jgi:two-component system response regulator YesN
LDILKNRIINSNHQDKYVIFSILLELMISTARTINIKQIKNNQFSKIDIFTYEFLLHFDSLDLLFEWLFEFFSFMSNAYTKRKNTEIEDQLTEKIKDYARKNLSNDINVSKVADFFHYNSNYIGRLFKQKEGIKFSEYLCMIRISKACELLKMTDHTVEAIASEVGFNNTQYFIKLFKEHQGSTPHKYRTNKVYGC